MKTVERKIKKVVEVEEVVKDNYLELQDFLKWLFNRGCLAAFLVNIGTNFKFIWNKHLSIPSSIFTGAFIWSITPEGVEYWWKVENDWKEYLGENNIKGLIEEF